MNSAGLRSRLFGRELQTAEAPHQAIGKFVGLAVFASDALSSVAYAPGEILFVLAAMGAVSFWMAIPIAAAICCLLIILTLSYRQTIFAYPGGGGAYIVARDNLGEAPAQAAGAALLTDYVLTVAVSIASGVDQIASAFPVLFNYKVQISLILILMIAAVNLRGVKESGRIFAFPTYFFITMMGLLLGAGFWQAATGALGTVGTVPGAIHETITFSGLAFGLLILRAFSSGTTAITGVEAISNGITAFKEPKSKNAAITMLWLATLLMGMFMGLVVLGWLVGAQASEQEVQIAQVARVVFGTGWIHLLVISSATIILIMAANTSFADFPRLTALHAGDGFLPRQFTFRGSRLVFSLGVVILAGFASLLILVFQGSVTRLIPLYAIGVFVSFTLSQAGMVKRWRRIGDLMRRGELVPGQGIETLGSVLHFDRAWRFKQALNAVGATLTAIVTVVFLVSKFTQGAWITMLLIPGLLLLFFRIHHHYRHVAAVMSTANGKCRPRRHHVHTIVLIDNIHQESLRLVDFAKSLGRPWEAVHVAVYPERIPEIRKKWAERVGEGEINILDSPYRSLSRPIRRYVQEVLRRHPAGFVNVIIGELVTGSPLTQILHQNSHFIQQLALQDLDGVVISIIPLQLETLEEHEKAPAPATGVAVAPAAVPPVSAPALNGHKRQLIYYAKGKRRRPIFAARSLPGKQEIAGDI